ncbi:pH-response regulator protein palH/rim21 [Savitreella phatthalungensis]
MANVSSTSQWPTGWSCTPALSTLNGKFTLYNAAAGASPQLFNYTGETLLNACLESVRTADAQLKSEQYGGSNASYTTAGSASGSSGVVIGNSALMHPFWDSTTPLIFTLGAATACAWVLLLVSVLAHSRRPWLQRLAAVFAVIAITLAADTTYREMVHQYYSSQTFSSDAVKNVHKRVANETLRIISNTLLWLAQLQVILRLFARQRDKVIIKYTAVLLILLEIIFACFNNFYPGTAGNGPPTSFGQAVPVLAYLFHIALSVLYAACIILWSVLGGRLRHAYHITLAPLATLCIAIVCSPVVFFCLDIWYPQVEGWGDYVRWVGLLASSVIVWDWIDQVQARQMRDAKNGVLGREVYEEEMDQDCNNRPPQESRTLNHLEARTRKLLGTTAWFQKVKSKLLTAPAASAASAANSIIEKTSSLTKRSHVRTAAIELPTFTYPAASSTASTTLGGGRSLSRVQSGGGMTSASNASRSLASSRVGNGVPRMSLSMHRSPSGTGTGTGSDTISPASDLSPMSIYHNRSPISHQSQTRLRDSQVGHSSANARTDLSTRPSDPHPGFHQDDYWPDDVKETVPPLNRDDHLKIPDTTGSTSHNP